MEGNTAKKETLSSENEFEKAARKKGGSTLGELWHFVRSNGKWWMIPFLVPVLIFGALMLFAGTGAAPFIYTIF